MKTPNASKVITTQPSMYASTPQLYKDLASLSFGLKIGEPLDIRTKFTGFGSVSYPTNNITPGIAVLDTVLTIGSTASGFDAPINKVNRALYSDYWSRNSSISNFQHSDIGIYTMASAQLVALIGWAKSVYYTAFNRDNQNKYVNSALLTAKGVDPTMIASHINDFRGFINMKLLDLMNVVLDGRIPLYRYAADMYAHTFKDQANVAKTQLYVIRPGKVLKYVRDGENIGSLEYVEFFPSSSYFNTYEDMINKFEEIWNAYMQSAYLSSISAALKKAVAEGDILKIAELGDGDREAPFFDCDALYRIRNAYITNGEPSSITQDVLLQTLNQTFGRSLTSLNAPETAGKLVGLVALSSVNSVMHAKDDEKTKPESNIVNGSLMVSRHYEGTIGSGDAVTIVFDDYGVEVVQRARIISFIDEQSYGATSVGTDEVFTGYVSAEGQLVFPINEVDRIVRMMLLLKDFDFFPDVRICVTTENTDYTSNPATIATVSDFDLNTVVADASIKKLHQSSVFAMFGQPDN